ncbi:MAG: serine hydrolase domain-containing protein, partial [Gemmatimonadales bacterium]
MLKDRYLPVILARACLPLLVWACGSSTTEPAAAVQVVPVQGLEGFEARLDSLRVELQIPGLSAAIAKDGEIVWSEGFGYSDAEAGRPATPTTPFHLASLTKPFAATIVMQLVEQGTVGLDDPVSDYG